MVIVAIGWLYVVMMIAAVSDSLLKGIVRFVFLGALPVGMLLWIKLHRYRSRAAAARDAADAANAGATVGAAAPVSSDDSDHPEHSERRERT